MRDGSPEKSPTKTPQHKRLQSLQNPSLKDFRPALENIRPLDWTNSRPATPSSARDFFGGASDRSSSRAETPTPLPKESSLETPAFRSGSTRPGPRPILGENTPPSATMLAIQNMPRRDHDSPLADISNGATPIARTGHTVDSLHSQMQNLTSIATTLQKEMNALSRRSKDNATDLISLKEATKSRDEDIRKSLKELVTNARASEFGLFSSPRQEDSRATSVLDFSPRYIDIACHTPTPFTKSISLPKIPTIDEQDRAASPSPYSVQGASTMSMLEKIVREMVTKEAQERLLASLAELLERAGQESKQTASKVAELVDFIKEKQTSQALVRHKDSRRLSLDDEPRRQQADEAPRSRDMSSTMLATAPLQQKVEILSPELREYLQKLKDSVAQGGGLTGEVKSLVRELRGEVLGMGRELGRRIDDASKLVPSQERSLTLAGNDQEHLSRVVQEGLVDLKEHMEQIIRAKRRESSKSIVSRKSLDSADVHALVRQSLEEEGSRPANQADVEQAMELDYRRILGAVNEAFDAHPFEPEVKVEYLGLDRDEILQCLREGLEEYRSKRDDLDSSAASKEEIFTVVQDAMQSFTPPTVSTEFSEMREELLMAVRDCLEDLKTSAVTQREAREHGDLTRIDILDAVREGFESTKGDGLRDMQINREDLLEAVSTGLDNLGYRDEVLGKLQEILESVRTELRDHSTAGSRDTDLVLDATRDGLENLRAAIESYVDRAQNLDLKEDIMQSMRAELVNIQANIQNLASPREKDGTTSERVELAELVNLIKTGFENLHGTLFEQTRSLDSTSITKEQIILAMTAGIAELKSGLGERDADGDMEEMLDAMKDEFESLRDSVLDGSAAHKDEILESIRDHLDSLQSRSMGGGSSDSSVVSNIIMSIKEEFESLRSSMSAPVLHSGQSLSNGELLESMQQQLENMRVQLSAEKSEAAEETLGAIREEFEHLRGSLATSEQQGPSLDDRVVILEAIRQGLDELRSTGVRGGDASGALDTVRQELEDLRESIQSAVVPSRGGQDDVITLLRSGFDDVRSQLDRIQDGASNRGEVDTAELLASFNAGIAGLKADIDSIKTRGGDVVLVEDQVDTRDFAVPPSGPLKREDLEKLEVDLTRLHIKLEAIGENVQAGQQAQNAHFSGGESLAGIAEKIADLQSSVASLAHDRAAGAAEGAAQKEDTDAIETLLLNAKAKIDDAILPGLIKLDETAATRDHLDTVEAVIRLTNEAIDGLSVKFGDNLASKDDVAAVYVLLERVSTAINETRDAQKFEGKTELDDLGSLCKGIEETVEALPGLEELASKEDMEQLNTLIKDFKTIHEGFKQQYETDLMVTAQAFDDRKAEAAQMLEQITQVKEVVEQSKEELKSRMRRGNEDVRALDEILQGIEDKIDAGPAATEAVQEVLRVVTAEFERAHAATGDIKSSHEEQFAALAFKHDEVKGAILEEVAKKLDMRVAELMARHDEQQLSLDQAAETLSDRALQQDRLMNDSKAMAGELKLTIDTLGASVTEITPALREATEKIDCDSKTVFNKVADIHGRLDANHVDLMTEHELTRQDISRSLNGIGGLREEFAAFQPQALTTLSSLLSIAGEHYDYAKRLAGQTPPVAAFNASIEETINRGFAAALPRLEAGPSAKASYDDSDIQVKLDRLLAHGKYDDFGKLDRLLEHAAESSKHSARFAKLDEIHRQVLDTAAGFASFVAEQKRSIVADHESKAEEARRAAEEVTRCQRRKEDLDATISSLGERKTRLSVDVAALESERDNLASQKSRLAAELSSIETALRIRREELQMMDARADALERRIIEGVMDHSRTLLMAKQPTSRAAPVNLSLKRVTSGASNATVSNAAASGTAAHAMSMALKKPAATIKKSATVAHPAARRNFSLSQITGNAAVETGVSHAAISPGIIREKTTASGLGNLKRSQSTRNAGLRKTTWAGQVAGGDFDKENEDGSAGEEEEDDGLSTTDRQSGTTTSMTHRSVSYTGTSLSGTDRRSSAGPSEYSYMTGSYMTGSTEGDRRTSFGSTIRSSAAGGRISVGESIDEEDEEESSVRHHDDDEDLVKPTVAIELFPPDGTHEESIIGDGENVDADNDDEDVEATDKVANLSGMPSQKPEAGGRGSRRPVIRGLDGYDSGLGSDLPTATVSSSGGSDYFPRGGGRR